MIVDVLYVGLRSSIYRGKERRGKHYAAARTTNNDLDQEKDHPATYLCFKRGGRWFAKKGCFCWRFRGYCIAWLVHTVIACWDDYLHGCSYESVRQSGANTQCQEGTETNGIFYTLGSGEEHGGLVHVLFVCLCDLLCGCSFRYGVGLMLESN